MNTLPLPPGPRGLPVLGSLHQLANDPHHAINRIARRYGDVCMIRIGRIPTVIISHPAILQEAFNQPEFSGRWVSRAFDVLTQRQSITTADYGEPWRGISELLHQRLSRPEDIASIINRQVTPVVEGMTARLAQTSESDEPVNVARIVGQASWDLIFATMFGNEPADPADFGTLKATMLRDTLWTQQASTKLSLGDLAPILRFMPDRWVRQARRQKQLRKQTLRRLFEIVRGRASFGLADPTCIMDFMLERTNGLSERTVETTCTDMILAANPVASILKWWLVILANRPDVQHAIHEEMEIRLEPSEPTANPSRLPYIASCFDECMRYRTATPLAVPHRATEDTQLAGFSIPAGTQVLANIHGIHHDERFWDEPDAFQPDRFFNEPNPAPRPESFMPFSVGIRACAGQHLGRAIAWEAATSMVRNLNFAPPATKPLSEREVFGLTLTPRPHNMLVKRYRSEPENPHSRHGHPHRPGENDPAGAV